MLKLVGPKPEDIPHVDIKKEEIDKIVDPTLKAKVVTLLLKTKKPDKAQAGKIVEELTEIIKKLKEADSDDHDIAHVDALLKKYVAYSKK